MLNVCNEDCKYKESSVNKSDVVIVDAL